jgi:hypothetical protein
MADIKWKIEMRGLRSTIEYLADNLFDHFYGCVRPCVLRDKGKIKEKIKETNNLRLISDRSNRIP